MLTKYEVTDNTCVSEWTSLHTHIKSSSKYTYQYMYLEDDLMCVCKLVHPLIAVAYLSFLMWSSKAVSHFSKLLAHTFPDKSPGIENVSQYPPTEIVLVMHCKNNCISVTKEWYQTGFLESSLRSFSLVT